MERTKCLLFIFIFLFAGAIVGSVAIMNVANNQTIEDFSLDTVEGYDESVIKDVVFNVKYGLCEDGYYDIDVVGASCEFQYANGDMYNSKYYAAHKIEGNGEMLPVNALSGKYEYIGDNKYVGGNVDAIGDVFYVFDNSDEYSVLYRAYIAGGVPDELHEETGGYKYIYGRDLWVVEEDVYFFEHGIMYKISKQELLELELQRGNSKETHYYDPLYTVPNEIDAIVGFKGGELLYLVGIGNVTSNGYTLYHYTVDVKTGKTINRRTYESVLPQSEATEITQDYLCYDYLPSDSYDIVTITQPSGYQVTYVIDKNNSDNDIYQLNLEAVLGDEFYISGLLETANKGNDTLYLMYAESQIGKMDYTYNWARRVIMDLENRIPMECPYGYEIWKVGYNGIAFIAIEKGEVIYKGYFTSDTYRAMEYTIKACMETGQYAMDIDLPKAYVESITIAVPNGGNAND